MTHDLREELQVGVRDGHRLTGLLQALGIPSSTWYRRPVAPEDHRPRGPSPKPIPEEVVEGVRKMAGENPWYGYKRIAVMCRRSGLSVTNRQAYRVMKDHGLLQKRRPRAAEIHQTRKLFELLPTGPNQLWQMDVTYIHIPGAGWHYAVTVIDYYSRYLLACHLTTSYCATEVIATLHVAREEAEQIHGPLTLQPTLVTDNGPSFIARRFVRHVRHDFSHVRIAYRTPTQLGLLERFHETLKVEEVYWNSYNGPAHCRECLGEFRERYNHRRPHWALVPDGGGDPVTPFEVYACGVATTIPRWQGWARAAKKRLEALKVPA